MSFTQFHTMVCTESLKAAGKAAELHLLKMVSTAISESFPDGLSGVEVKSVFADANSLKKLVENNRDGEMRVWAKPTVGEIRNALGDEAVSPKTKNGKKRQKKKLGQPKRPLSAYMRFCAHRRPLLASEQPTLTFSDLSKRLGSEWKTLPDGPEKTGYYSEEKLAKEKFVETMKIWKQKVISDEDALVKGKVVDKSEKKSEVEEEPLVDEITTKTKKITTKKITKKKKAEELEENTGEDDENKTKEEEEEPLVDEEKITKKKITKKITKKKITTKKKTEEEDETDEENKVETIKPKKARKTKKVVRKKTTVQKDEEGDDVGDDVMNFEELDHLVHQFKVNAGANTNVEEE